jgi:DNA-binding MarR family transcriptional regulator/GNAT superfamily N-acetyltransferase
MPLAYRSPQVPPVDLVPEIRSFNRTITRRLGVLDDSFLGCGLSLGKARLLFEIGGGVSEVRRLREKLDLDSGQMSRLLRSLEQRGLIRTAVDRTDGRARTVALTRAGRAKLAELDRKSDEGALSWLSPLGAGARLQLREAMATVVRILRASEIVIDVEDPRSAAARSCFDQYARELQERFEAGFDPARAKTARPEEMELPKGFLLLARVPDDSDRADGSAQPIGCVALRLDGKRRVGEVKRMWVSADARGIGLGRRLLESVEERARRLGVGLLRLETNRVLVEAQTLYRASGYREIPLFDDEPYAHLAFEKRLG